MNIMTRNESIDKMRFSNWINHIFLIHGDEGENTDDTFAAREDKICNLILEE